MKKSKINGLGIDMVEIFRFNDIHKKIKSHSLHKFFSEDEIKYCLSHKNPAPHFAGIFAAKEAVSKAMGVSRYPFIELEIGHTKDGLPEAWNKNERLPVRISITHTDSLATAVAML